MLNLTNPPEKRYDFVAVDVETANSDAGSICQIGIACVQMDGTIKTYKTLVNPLTHFDGFNVSIHGITAEMAAEAPPFNRAVIPYMKLMTSHKIIHHSPFDKRAFKTAFEDNDMPFPDMQWHDSVIIARRAWPEFKGDGGHGLANLKIKLGLDFEHHDAEEDAKAAAMVVLAALKRTNRTIEELTQHKTRQDWAKAVTKTANNTGKLFGAIACFTGKVSMSREDAATLAARAGMEVKAGVTKKTTILIVGDQDLNLLAGHKKSSKHRKAETMVEQGHPIEIIGETEFLRLLELAGVT